MGRIRYIVVLISVFGITNVFANTAPYFTKTVKDTLLTEDEEWHISLSATDPDGDNYFFSLADDVPIGMNIDSIFGDITWTPTNEDVGVHQITAIVSDGSLSGYLTFFLYVNNVNDPPFWVNITEDTVTVAEDSDLEITVTANDNDLMHGDHIKYLIIHGPESVNIDSTSGTITGIPNNSDVGFYTITVRAQDDSLAAVDWTFKLEVTNTDVVFTNSPPTEINEDDYFEFNINSNDESQGNTVYYFQTGFQPGWIGLVTTTGVINGTPTNEHVGTGTVKIIVDDDNGSTDTLSYDLTIVNRKPIITTSTLHSATEDIYFALDINADDEGIGTTSYRFLDSLNWLSIDSLSGVVSGIPTNAHVGSNSFYLEFNDGNGGKDSTQFVINVINDPVQIDTTNLVYEISEDQEYYYKFTSSDDGQGTVTYHGIGLPDWLSLGLNTGILQGTPNNENVGDLSISIYVFDGTDSDTISYTIHVENRVPQKESAEVTDATEDSEYTYDIDYDDEGEGAVYSWQIQPSWLSLNASTGLLSGTPDNSDVGDVSVQVRIDDGNGGVVFHTFLINVVNRNPVFAPQADTTITQGTNLSIQLMTDDDNDPEVTYSWETGPPESGLSLSGLITWPTDNSHVGDGYFEVVATDNHGGSSTITFTVTVTNAVPVITSTAPTTATENTLYQYNVQCNEEGIGDVVYSLTTAPNWLSINSGSGLIQGTPGNPDVDNHDVTVKVDDGNGGIVTQSWAITVSNINPTIVTEVLNPATEDSLYNFQIDYIPINEGDHTFSLVGDKPAWITINALDGLLSGTPINSEVGIDSITIRIEDGNGGSDEKRLEIVVNNSLAVFTTTDNVTVTEDEALDWDITTNDEGDEGPNASGYNLVTAPNWMSINSVTGVLSGTPLDDNVGIFPLSIRYRDGNGGIVTLDVNIIVSNNPPVFTSLSPTSTATEDVNYSFQFTSDDDDRGYVTYDTLKTLPLSLTLTSTGLLSGAPKNQSVGSHNIGVIATDKNGGKDTLEYTLTISNTVPSIDGYILSISPYIQTGDTLFVTEDLPYKIDFSSTDESDGSSALYTVNHKPSWLSTNSLVLGTLNGTPDNRHVGLDSIDITFSDGNGSSDTKKIYIVVQNVISDFVDPPSTVTATEDAEFSLDLNSTDEGQGTITYSIVSGDPGWIDLDATTGEINSKTNRPDNDDVTDGQGITFQVTDGNGGTATKTIIFVVENVNDSPTWLSAPVSGSTVSTAEDVLYTVDLDAGDVDVGDNITYSLDTSPTGMIINSTTGVISWTPDNSQVGNHSVTVRAEDNNFAAITQSWTVQITNVASPITTPVVDDFIPSDAVTAIVDTFYIKEDTTYTLNLSAPDENVGAASIYSFDEFPNPDWVVLSNAVSGIVGLTPTNGDVGLDSFQVYFKDQPGLRDTVTIYVRVENVAPAILTEGPFTATEGVAFRDTLESSDDGDGAISWSFKSGKKPGWLSIGSSTGVMTGTPGNSDVVADASFTIEVNDGNGGLTEKVFDYSVENVNNDPVWTSVPSETINTNEDNLYTVTITADDDDAGDVLTYSLVSPPARMSINSSSGVITWTPDNSQVGDNLITVKAADLSGSTITSSWTLHVNNLNDAPTWVSVPGGTINSNEDELYTTTIEAADIDVGDNIAYSLTVNPAGMTIGVNTGVIEWTPTNDHVGLHSITVKATDDSSANITGGWTLNVHNVNDDPTWTAVPTGTVTIAEDAVYTVDVDAVDIDAGDVITYSLTQKPVGMSIVPSTGVISWTPDNSDVGSHTITVKATDLTGGFTSQNFILQVTNVASPITAPADTFYIKEDTSYTLDLSSPDENVGAASIYSFDDFPNPDWVTLSNATTGIVSLTPTNGDVGLDSFLIYFKDQPGSRDTITIYLRVENVAPEILTDGPFTATECVAFSQQLESSDDGDGTIIWSFVSGKPDWLSIGLSTGVLTGIPGNSDVVADASFTIEVNDGNGGLTEKVFDYSVENVNNDPVWTSVPSGTINTNEDSLYTVTITADDDDAGDVLTYSLVSPPTGMEIIPGTGAITWTPDNSQVGNHSITVKATDLSNAAVTSNWILSVTNSPSQIESVVIGDFQPAGIVSATVDTFFIREDSTYTLDLNAYDEGLGDAPVYRTTNLSNPDWVTLSNTQSGLITLNPINKDVGLDSFRVVFEDRPGSTDTIKIYIRINNSPPTMIAAGPFSATEDVAFESDLESSDEDAFTSYSFVSDYPAWMSINASTGLITGTPANDAVGPSTFTVRVNDGHGGTDDQLYTINVANTNDPPIITSSAITSATEDVLYIYDLEATDQDGDPISYHLVTFPEGMTIDTGSGLIRWTPDNNYGGSTVSVKASVEDTTGSTVFQSWYLLIENAAPNFLTADTLFDATEDEEFSVDLSVDDEGQGLTGYSVIHLPGWMALTNSSTGLIGGTPDNSYVNSSDSVHIEFSDGNGGKDTLNVPVNVVNIPPVYTVQNDTTVFEGDDIVIDLDCDDETAGGVTYSALLTLPDWLTLNSATGELTGTPGNSGIGIHNISIRATDAFSGFASIAFQITVLNTAPAFTGTPLTIIEEDSLYEYILTLSDNSGTNTFQILTNPGWLSINGSSDTLSGTPRNNHVGDNFVSVSVDDGNGALDTLDFVITVSNSAPVFATIPTTAGQGQEDKLYSLDLNCSDEGQGTMIYTALRKPGWLTLNSTTGLLKGIPLNQHVTTGDTVEIMVNDGNGGFDTLKYSLAITNRGPSFTHIFTDTTITEDDAFFFDINSDDEGQGDTEYSFTNIVPDWITLDSTTGVISGTPLNNHVTDFADIYIKVDDGNGGVKPYTITFNVTNNPAQFTSTIIDSIATEDELFTYDANTDDEAQGAGVYTFTGLPEWLNAHDTTGIITGTPTNDDIDTWAITIQFSDGNGSIVEQLIYVIVQNANDAPILTATTVHDTIDEDSHWSFRFSAMDIDSAYGDTLSFELREFPVMMQVDSSAGIVSWTPLNADVGDTSFELWVFDKDRASDSLKFSLHINNTNDAPVLIAQADMVAKEDEFFSYTIRYEDVDVGDSVMFGLLNAPPGMMMEGDIGLIYWTPTNDDRDTTFEIICRVTDGAGGMDLDTFNIFVENVNDAPVIAELDSIDIFEDSVFKMQFSEWFDKVSDIDNADSTLSWEVISFANLSVQTTVDSLILIGLPDWFGSDTGEVIVSDGELSDTTELIVNILPVNDPPVIDAGFPSIISFTEDDTTELDLNLYVSDVDNDLLDLNWSVFPVESAKSKSDKELVKSERKPFNSQLKSIRLNPFTAALINSEGDSIIISIDTTTNIAKFYAKPDFFIDGYDFTFVVNDSVGLESFGSDTVAATIQVNPANDPPVLMSLPELNADEDSTITVVLSDWFEFVADVDNHDTTLVWSVINGNHTVGLIIDSILTITPVENWFGNDTLRLVVTDDELLSDTADIIVHYQSVNDPPVFSPIADIAVPEDDTLYIELNDYVEDVETVDADLTFSVRRFSTGGKSLSSTSIPISKNSSMKKEYLLILETKSSLNDFSSVGEAAGEDSIRIVIDALTHIASISGTPDYYTDFQAFTFYVSDGDSLDSIYVNIAIESVNDKPVLDSLPSITFSEDSLYVLYLSQWDSLVYDVEDSDDTLRWSFEIGGTISVSYDTTNRKFTLYGGANYSGAAALTVIVTDLGGLSDTSIVDMNIIPVNDPPVIDSSLFTILFDQKDTVDFILDNYVSDVDHNDQSLSWQFTAGDHVYLDYNDTTRIVTFWSAQDWFGADTVLAVVKDPQNGADTQLVYITVTDTTKPSFELAVLQNQLASKYVEIDIFPSELLLENALITTDGDTLEVTQMTYEDSIIYYNATYKIDSTKTVFIYAKGVDRAGNIGDFEYRMGVAKISKEVGGSLTDPDSIMTFLFEPNSVQQDICALFLPYEIETQIEPALGKIAFMSEEVFPVSNEFDFRIPVTKLENKARIIFSLENMEFLQQYAASLGVYIWQNDEWKYLTTYTSLEKGTYWTYSDKPGIYQIRVDPDNPAIILPEEIRVSQNYPNPFNSLTTIEYTIGAGGFRTFDEAFEQLMSFNVSIKVYNILGQEVKTLVKDSQLPGFYTITWDGRNRYGQPIATGLYFYQVIIGEKVFNKKMTILK